MRDTVLRHTLVATPPLCPELRLHLITEACPLWRANEADLERQDLQDPFWGFAWPGGQALARFVLDRTEICKGKRVLAFGAGSGIEALAAVKAGAACVRATDLDPVAVAACKLNAELNGLALEADSENVLGNLNLDVDVVLAADVTYEMKLGEQVIDWLRSLAEEGILALVSDPHRGFLPSDGLELVASYEAPADVDPNGHYWVSTAIRRVLPKAASRED